MKGEGMKKPKYWWIGAGLMAGFFALTSLWDYVRYFLSAPVVSSAPYLAFVTARAIEFLTPAAILAVVALVLQVCSRRSAAR